MVPTLHTFDETDSSWWDSDFLRFNDTNPLNLSVTETDRLAGQVTLRWNAGDWGADSYSVQDNGEVIQLNASSPFIVSGLQVDTGHRFKVIALFSGFGVQSNEVPFQFGSSEFGAVDALPWIDAGSF